MANLLQSGVASAERVFDLLDADEQSEDPEIAETPNEVHGRLLFENVSFRYTEDRPLIEELSLVAEAAQTIAIVGPTGAGKTTLVNLMMRFYEIGSGRILLDGVDIATMTRHDLRSNVSAGEMQLLTIARAFLAQPSVLILDEATSSVDTRTEVLVQKAMRALRAERTSFVIAHRLSTIRDADLILVMESGRIVEQGNHVQLLAANGAYQARCAAQFAAPVTDEV